MTIPGTVSAAAVILTVMATSAAAQPLSGAANPRVDHVRGWSVSAGYEEFALRDVSRNMRPVDASPVRWIGTGPVVGVRHDRRSAKALHSVAASVAVSQNFVYRSPITASDGLPADKATRLHAQYEYRRYPLRNLGFDGFDVGLGVQAIATRLSMRRSIAPALEAATIITGAGAAGVLAARLQRWDRVRVEVGWANGGVAGRRRSEHSADTLSVIAVSGGNWLTETTLNADVRLSQTAVLFVAYQRADEGFSSQHFSYSGSRRSFAVGLTYER